MAPPHAEDHFLDLVSDFRNLLNSLFEFMVIGFLQVGQGVAQYIQTLVDPRVRMCADNTSLN